AESRRDALAAAFPGRVGLAHGRLKPAEKDAAMAAFAGVDASGGIIPPAEQTDVLVATTVVEVGVDVATATLIVIEDAERFGLAQLHQLRGRVGRGDAASACLLLYAGPLSETAQARLRAIRDSDDGFAIAEEDLRLRGGGDVLGPKQSGLPGFRLADAAAHGDLLLTARDDARLALERDPALTSPRGRALRLLLHLQDSADAVRTLESG
ncbi:MAG: helicase-related protein, partial [Pseudomonadota bacterium]